MIEDVSSYANKLKRVLLYCSIILETVTAQYFPKLKILMAERIGETQDSTFAAFHKANLRPHTLWNWWPYACFDGRGDLSPGATELLPCHFIETTLLLLDEFEASFCYNLQVM